MKTTFAIAACVATMMTAGAAWAQGAGGFDWKKYDGQTITFLSSNHPWPNALLPHIEEFKKLTGINVRVDTYNEMQMRTRLTTLLQTKSSEFDIFMTLPSREGLLYDKAGWYADIGAMVADTALTSPDYDFADFAPNLLQKDKFDGKVRAIPLNIEGPALYYRKDILAECKVEPPKTLAEVTDAAKKLKACKPDITPFVSRGLQAALAYTFVPFYYNMGGTYEKLKEKQAYCSATGEKAIQDYANLLKEYGPPGVTNYTFYQVTELMGQGRAAMSFEATNEFGKVMAYPDRLKDTEIGLLPPGPDQKPLVINWSIAISAFSKKQGPAWYFVQWATSKEMDERLAFDGIAPPRKSVFEGERFAKWTAEEPVRQHWVDTLKKMGEVGITGSAPANVARTPEVSEALGVAISKVMQGQATAKEAGCELDTKLIALLP